MIVVLVFILVLIILEITNIISYGIMKEAILYRQTWDLNICCGKTDGGGINVDIVQHKELPRFLLVKDIYSLPFEDKTFTTVLSSHTIEHLDDPVRFFEELKRVGEKVSLVIPPLWDVTAAFNFFEHKWLFLTLRKEHQEMPRYIKLPFARSYQNIWGQKIKA